MYNISSKSSWEALFNGNIFGNVVCHYYYQKPDANIKTRYANEKFFINSSVIYIVQKVMKSAIQW